MTPAIDVLEVAKEMHREARAMMHRAVLINPYEFEIAFSRVREACKDVAAVADLSAELFWYKRP